MRFKDKTVVITGAASGMGRSAALGFAREGAAVVACDLLEDEAASLLAELDAAGGGGARFVRLDVAREEDWEVLARMLRDSGGLDVLFNNAGISGTFDPDLSSTRAWERLLDVNAKGVFLGMKHAVPLMRPRGGGAIVNMSSISASVGQHRVHMGYSASKAAVQAMTRAAAVHYAEDGIRVNAVAPGLLPPMRTSRGSADPVWREKQIDAVPLKRAGHVEEVATAVLFLASDEASYITGVELAVDGGFLSL
ncbi:SDR family NAD(P)-dependent oxidoreductase [Castellaniella sp. GW247-6E4]|uniref:SDR family NAD(P)-dependent oxidoreductase n=1 Tax=Castellaniella sp. GW247-6E4 TaxID=3140380 RepID=UPI003314DC7B